MPDVSPYVGIALAVVAVLSLAVQGLIKALDIVGKRNGAHAPAPAAEAPIIADPLTQSGKHQAVSLPSPDEMLSLMAYVQRQADDQPATRRDLGDALGDIDEKIVDLSRTLTSEAKSTRRAVQSVRDELKAHAKEDAANFAALTGDDAA